jgi:hypothetical protein
MHPAAHHGVRLLILGAAAASVAATTPSSSVYAQGRPSAEMTPALTTARAALEKYRDPVQAIHDGYLSLLGCIEYPKGGTEGSMQYAAGGMGVHFLNPQHIGPTLDAAKPQVLIYEPAGDSLRLVAAEWFMPAQLAGGAAPSIFGRTLDGPMEGHKPLMPTALHHYDLHVWLWKPNPAGIFSPTNPAVKCPNRAYTFREDAPGAVSHGKH